MEGAPSRARIPGVIPDCHSLCGLEGTPSISGFHFPSEVLSSEHGDRGWVPLFGAPATATQQASAVSPNF